MILAGQPPALEQRPRQVRREAPSIGAAAGECRKFRADLSEQSGEADLWKIIRHRHAHLRVGRTQVLVRLADVWPPFQQRGRQTRRRFRHPAGWSTNPSHARTIPGAWPSRTLICVFRRAICRSRSRNDRRRGRHQRLGRRGLQLRRHAALHPFVENLEALAERIGGFPGDFSSRSRASS